MRQPPYLGLAITAGAILVLSVALFYSYLPYVGGSLAPKEPPAVVLAMENAYLVGVSKRGKLWSLNAKRVEVGRDRSISTITGITNGKVFEKDKVVLKMAAGRAVYDSRQENLMLSGGIRVEGNNGELVETEGAHWNSVTSTLQSTGKVKFRSDWASATSSRMVVNTKKNEMTMWNVSISIKIDEL